MYIQTIYSKRKDGSKNATTLLYESYRENGKQKRRTVANFSELPVDMINTISQFLVNEKNGITTANQVVNLSQGKSFGAFLVFFHLAKEIGLWSILGNNKQGQLALLQIIARIISQKSRLHIASFYPQHYALEEIIGIDYKFDEDDLYDNLDWLCENQQLIENKLFKKRIKLTGEKPDSIYLYDVTSSYLEGTENELAAFGYNRDKKKGKKQIVIGLLTDKYGYPMSIEVFKGNTNDTKTVKSQIEKLASRFELNKVIFVGDKGMVKTQQINDLTEQNWNYITSITKEQIETLLQNKIISMTLFCDELCEVEIENTRYILRRNPDRQLFMQKNRADKELKVSNLISKSNQYLSEHSRGKIDTQINKIKSQIKRYKLQHFLSVEGKERKILQIIDCKNKDEIGKLDGCYVIKTNVNQSVADKETIHQRYKDLSKVESSFRLMKSGIEEIRPLYIRNGNRTKAHVFVCMLAYLLLKKFDELTKRVPLTLADKIDSINKMNYVSYKVAGITFKKVLTEYNSFQNEIIKNVGVKLPKELYAKNKEY